MDREVLERQIAGAKKAVWPLPLGACPVLTLLTNHHQSSATISQNTESKVHLVHLQECFCITTKKMHGQADKRRGGGGVLQAKMCENNKWYQNNRTAKRRASRRGRRNHFAHSWLRELRHTTAWKGLTPSLASAHPAPAVHSSSHWGMPPRPLTKASLN